MNMRGIILIACGLLVSALLWPHVASAREPEHLSLRFNRLDISDGLSQGMIFCMFQDSRGFMWFGTKEGLNRYDGYHFLVYRNRPGDRTSLPDNFISRRSRKIRMDVCGSEPSPVVLCCSIRRRKCLQWCRCNDQRPGNN